MATTDKDFKVKNGLAVALGGSFGGTVTVASPTLDTHATTKSYVDALVATAASLVVGETAPESPVNGDLWLDTVSQRLYISIDSQWVGQASLADTTNLPDHIHDTAIDGSGLIVSTFVSGGAYNEPGALVSAGSYDTTSFEQTWVGGEAIDNFN